MKNVKNSDRLREILVSTRHQIVALQDIKIEMISINSAIAKNIEQQIDALEEVYKHQLTLVSATQEIEPKRRGWFTGNIKTKEDRLANIMD
jgi:hypothetical protein